jgi:flavorubredoxin
MADALHYIRGLRPQRKIGAAFGSYGWSGEGVRMVEEALKEMKVEIVCPPIKVQYVPDKRALEECVQLGRTVGRAVKEKL